MMLAGLGLSTRTTVYRSGRIRVYVDTDGRLRCQWCSLDNVDLVAGTGRAMAGHVLEHGVVPDDRLANWLG